MQEYYSYIYVIIIFCTALLGFLFLDKARIKGKPSKYLGVYFLCWLAVTASNYLFSGMPTIRLFGLALFQACWFMGPMLYAYDRSSAGSFGKKEKIIAFIPPLSLSLVNFFMEVTKDKMFDLTNDLLVYFYSIGSLVPLVYLYLFLRSFHSLRFGQKRVSTYVWHAFLYYGFLIISVLRFGNTLASRFLTEWYEWYYFPLLIIISIYLTVLLYKGLRSSLLLNPGSLQEHLTSEKEYLESKPMYEAIVKDVNRVLIEGEFLKNADLKMDDISRETNTKSYLISKALNSLYNKSLSEYLNDQRIEQAVRLLESHSESSVKQIMYEVGYNSKSLFYSEFKKRIGYTPQNYRASG